MTGTELKSLASYIVDEMESRGLLKDRMMDIVEVSEYLHMPISSIYQSKIPRKRVGKRLLFSERDLQKWIRK